MPKNIARKLNKNNTEPNFCGAARCPRSHGPGLAAPSMAARNRNC
jgi:hypothetical protein